MDGLGRTYGNTLTAQTALVEVNVGHIVLDGDGSEGTLLLTLATTDTSGLAGLHSHRTLVLVDTRHEDLTALRTFLANSMM